MTGQKYLLRAKAQTPEQKRLQKTLRMVMAIALLCCYGCGALLLLSGCSSTLETFDTQPVQGVGAKSISQVNAMVERGELDSLREETSPTKMTAPVFSTLAPSPVNVDAVQLSDTTLVYRQPEKHLRVWIAPFQDPSGNLHEGSLVHTLVRSGFWHMNPNPFNG